MEEEEEMSDVYMRGQAEDSGGAELMVESEHHGLAKCDGFPDLDDSLFFDSLPAVEEGVPPPAHEMEVVDEMVSELSKGAIDMEMPHESLQTEAPQLVLETEHLKQVPDTETSKEITETEMPTVVTDTEVPKEANERGTPPEAMVSETLTDVTEMDTPKEVTEIEAASEVKVEKEATETEVANEMMETQVEKGTTDAETEAVKEDTLTEDALEAKDALETEVAVDMVVEAPRPRKGGGKKKRGRAALRVQSKPKMEEEDVCFICFDGGNLVLCDRRGCPKAYHPSCINRDESFFRSRGRWNCGWHICSQCQKTSHYMCYTCTYSLCRGCIKEAGFLCVRGDKGLCGTCMRTVMLIEQNVPPNKEMAAVDFDDKSNWEYLFKDYWLDLKNKLSITSDELAGAKNPQKGSGVLVRNDESSGELYDANDDHGSSSDSFSGHNAASSSARKKPKKRSRSGSNEESSPSAKKAVHNEVIHVSDGSEWASSELLELVAYMKDGDTSVLSQFDVQALLIEYIKRNNLRDPRKKSQIVCDTRLQNLFGKARVGHIEMLKLLESHFLVKDATDDTQGGVTDSEAINMESESNTDAITKSVSDKKRKTRKRVEEREHQANLDDYAAIDVHNINLVYLRRNLMEDLLDDMDKFHNMVVGSFVRIRIFGASQKQDVYRLVQIVGTGKAAAAYKSGKKATDVTLEILNLNKTEIITIDTISNQEFSEEECKRLRQSIKCGFISRLTVGEIQEKAKALQAVRVKDWLETEVLRLSHLRDRASETGRRKELRECVEKLELLNTPEERLRRLQELPEVHADPNMDPSYISDEEEDVDDTKQDDYFRSRDSGFIKKGREQSYSGKGSSASNDGWNGQRKVSTNSWDSTRNMQTKGGGKDRDGANVSAERTTDSSWNQGRDVHPTNIWETPKSQAVNSLETGAWNSQPVTRTGLSPNVVPELASDPSAGVSVLSNICETDKIWHYQDPAGKIQGPFNMTQLRKWSKTGYFPADLRIWRATEKREDSTLLTDALIGKFQKEPLQWEAQNSSSQYRTNTLTRVDNQQSDESGKSNWNSAGPMNGNADGWGARSASSFVAPTELVDHKEIYSPQLRDPSISNAWSGPTQNHSPKPSTPFSGQSHRMPFYHARESQGEGNSRWDSTQSRGNTWNMGKNVGFQSGSSGQSSAEAWKIQQENSSLKDREMPSAVLPSKLVTQEWVSDQGNGNDPSNLPTPTPNSSSSGWPEGQGTENALSASSTVQQATVSETGMPHSLSNQPVSGQPLNVNFAAEGKLVPRASSVLVSSEASGSSGTTLGSEDHHTSPLLGLKPPSDLGTSSLLKFGDSKQFPYQISGMDQRALVSLTADPGQQKRVLETHSPSVVEGAPPANVQGPDPPPSSALRLADPPSRSSEVVLQATEDFPVKAPSVSGVPLSESLPSGNFVGQSNTRVSNWSGPPGPAVNPFGWDMGVAAGTGNSQNNSTRANPWGPAQGYPNMNWGIPGQGNANSGWVTGAPGNANMGWGGDAQGNKNVGWGPNPQGNAYPSLDACAGNSNIWANQPKQSGERFIGQGDRGFQTSDPGHGGPRPSWNRGSGGGGASRPPPRGSRVCKYHESGYCKKGASCHFLHT